MPPEAIQLLTFNKAASTELSTKLCTALGEGLGKKVGVNTFHSLAYHVLKCSSETQHLTLSFKDEDRNQTATLSDLEKAVISETTPRDFGHYRRRYEDTSYAYRAREVDFDEAVQEFATGAAALYRARQGTPKPIKQNPITRHLERVVANYGEPMQQSRRLDGEAGLREAARILASDAALAGFNRLNGGLQFLFVDEFQDFSAAFSEITRGVMSRNPTCVMNAVGDDWQSINSFMGADLSFFNGMKKTYDATLNLPLQSNWRCGKRIVALGNSIMGASKSSAALPALSHEGKIRVRVGDIRHYRRSKDAWHAEAQEFLALQIDRMAQAAWKDDADAGRERGTVAILATKNTPFGQSLSSYARQIDTSKGGHVAWSTSHSSKGSEWDHVIVLDGTASHYPAAHPSHPAERDMITRSEREAEEQRLLYVAVTRAKQSLAILAPTELHPDLRHAVSLARC